MGSIGSVKKQSTPKETTPATPSFLDNVIDTVVNKLFGKDIADVLDVNSELQATIMDTINPKYFEGSAYEKNCALCTTALEMQARGEDVQAAARDSTWRGPQDYLDMDLQDYDSYVVGTTSGKDYTHMEEWNRMKNTGSRYENMRVVANNPNKFATRSAQAYDSLKKYMDKWGPNSRAELSVWWSSGSRHSVFVTNTKKGPVIIDGQDGVVYYDRNDVQGLFSHTKITKTLLYRLDNRQVKGSFSGDRDKMVTRRKK